MSILKKDFNFDPCAVAVKERNVGTSRVNNRWSVILSGNLCMFPDLIYCSCDVISYA